MTTAATDTKPSTAGPLGMEQRLDALDRALLGILPRSERLALVAQVETRVRELADGNTAAQSTLETALEPEIVASAVSTRASTSEPKRRSRLALSSGILGIVALVLLFAMPITYFVVALVGESFGELVSIGLLGMHVLTVAIGGLVALFLGIAGLVSLSRRKGRLVGHGWAITGLCTAPLPTLVGGLLVLVTGLSLFAVQTGAVDFSAPNNVVPSTTSYGPIPPTESYAPNLATPYAPVPMMKASTPLPLSAAPSYCPPGEATCPPLLPPSSNAIAPATHQAPDDWFPIPTSPNGPAPSSLQPLPLNVPPPASATPPTLR